MAAFKGVPQPTACQGASVIGVSCKYINGRHSCSEGTCLCFQTRYDVWRRLLKTFWAVVVGYSMVVLIAIYMYQFRSVSGLFRQILGMSEEGWVSVELHPAVMLVPLGRRGTDTLMLPSLCVRDQSQRSGLGTVRHGGAVCTYSAPCYLPVGLHPPAALLQLRFPDSHGPWQRTCETGFKVRQHNFQRLRVSLIPVLPFKPSEPSERLWKLWGSDKGPDFASEISVSFLVVVFLAERTSSGVQWVW